MLILGKREEGNLLEPQKVGREREARIEGAVSYEQCKGNQFGKGGENIVKNQQFREGVGKKGGKMLEGSLALW